MISLHNEKLILLGKIDERLEQIKKFTTLFTDLYLISLFSKFINSEYLVNYMQSKPKLVLRCGDEDTECQDLNLQSVCITSFIMLINPAMTKNPEMPEQGELDALYPRYGFSKI